ncbi:MAG: DDE-type integrase/transposase/recombinase [Rhodospirillaceae bacterium]|nr:DDE-type integrase/transposase/recombinase [Rhodospirillales bacterium]
MPSLALARNQRIWIDDAMHEVRGRTNGEVIHLERVRDGELRVVTHRELAELICADKAKIVVDLGKGREAKIIEDNLDREIAALPEPSRRELDRRQAYVRAIEEEGVLTLTDRSLSGLIRHVAELMGDERPPHWTTLYRWVTRLRKASGDIRALVPAIHRRGNRTRRLDSDVIRLIDEGLDQRFLKRERAPARSAHDYVVRMIDDMNQVADPAVRLRAPSLRTIYRAITRLDDYEVTMRRFGKRIADLKYRVAGQAPKPTRPLERVEIDHTKLDLIVVDDELGQAIGRPWLTLAVDVHSRMPVGFHLGFDDPSFDTVMRCLHHSVLPKTYVRERYPEIKNDWACYGVPETVVVDNGREFHSKDFELACHQLGVQIQHTPRKSPWMKGTVERFFGQLNQGLIHSQPGTTFSNIFDRADYDPRKNGVIPFSLLVEFLHHWVIEVYSRSEHRGIADIPADRWAAGVREYPVRLPAKAADLDIVLWRTHQKPVHHYGIEIASIVYNSEELGDLRRRHAGKLRTTVKFDPDDLSRILVLDPERGAFFKVPAVSPDYTRGLTLWQHRVIRAEARRRRKGRLDIVDLARAREWLTEKANEIWRGTGKTRIRQKVARFFGIDSRDRQGPMDAQPPVIEITPPPPTVAPQPRPLPPVPDDDDWTGGYDLPKRR